MILTVCPEGHVATAVHAAVAGLHEGSRAAVVDDEDLFSRALGCRAIVYAPVGRLLEATPHPAPTRIESVLRAAHAPPVSLVVVVEPSDDAWTAEEERLRKDGVPYVIIRSGPLVEELADAVDWRSARSVWLPHGHHISVAMRESLVSAIARAFVDPSLCGQTLTVPSEDLELGDALRRAALLAGSEVRVHVTSPGISFAMRRLSSWMGTEPLEVENLADRLAAPRRLHA